MAPPPTDLNALLDAIDPQAPLAERHLWLIAVLQWIRGDASDADKAVSRVRLLIDAAERRPAFLSLWHDWWAEFLTTVDATPLLADLGFAAYGSLGSELQRRLHRRLLPVTPETTDLSELFRLLFPSEFDARWLRALDERTLARLTRVLFGGAGHAPANAAPAQPGEAAVSASNGPPPPVQSGSAAIEKEATSDLADYAMRSLMAAQICVTA